MKILFFLFVLVIIFFTLSSKVSKSCFGGGILKELDELNSDIDELAIKMKKTNEFSTEVIDYLYNLYNRIKTFDKLNKNGKNKAIQKIRNILSKMPIGNKIDKDIRDRLLKKMKNI